MSTTQAALLDALERLLNSDAHVAQASDKDLRAAATDMTIVVDARIREKAAAALQARAAIAAANAAPYRAADGCCHKTVTKRCDDYPVDEQAEPVLDATGERERFEEWFEADAMPAESNWFDKDADGDYELDFVHHAWRAWEARSALSQPIADPQECGTGAMCCYMAAMRDHEEEKAQALKKCPACGGNDENLPCAYPGKWEYGCLRDARLAKGNQRAEDAIRLAAEPQELPVLSDVHALIGNRTIGLQGFTDDGQKTAYYMGWDHAVTEVVSMLSRKPSADKEASK